MIKENQKLLNRLQIVIDAIVIYASFCFSYYVRFICPLFDGLFPKTGYYRKLVKYQPMLIILVILMLIIYDRFNLYQPRRFRSRLSELRNIIKSNTVAIFFFLLVIVFFKVEHVPRSLILLFYVFSTGFTVLQRFAVRTILAEARKNGNNLKHIVLVGFSPAAMAYIDKVRVNPQWGYQIHGILDDGVADDFTYKEIPVIGFTTELEEYLAENDLDEVVITLSLTEYRKLEKIVFICEKAGVHTKFVPDYYKFISTNPVTEDLDGLPVINIRNIPLTNAFSKFIKRTFDIIGSILCIILFGIPMIVVAILVKRSSPGPILFKQERIGLHNKPFTMLKFRSMGVQTAAKEKQGWTTANDPRITPVGKVIRKTSLDELPQLFNVLKGEMSLIGPRPERPQFVEKFKEEIPRYMIKHQVRPGMTGWAQVCGFRGDTSIEGRIEHDLFYIENWSLGFDIKILFLTIFKGFVNENAY